MPGIDVHSLLTGPSLLLVTPAAVAAGLVLWLIGRLAIAVYRLVSHYLFF